jgi:hypothetical protein
MKNRLDLMMGFKGGYISVAAKNHDYETVAHVFGNSESSELKHNGYCGIKMYRPFDNSESLEQVKLKVKEGYPDIKFINDMDFKSYLNQEIVLDTILNSPNITKLLNFERSIILNEKEYLYILAVEALNNNFDFELPINMKKLMYSGVLYPIGKVYEAICILGTEETQKK